MFPLFLRIKVFAVDILYHEQKFCFIIKLLYHKKLEFFNAIFQQSLNHIAIYLILVYMGT
jgi:hypothetical protein